MDNLADLYKQTLPIAYANIVLEIAKDYGFNQEQVLENAALPQDLMTSSSGYITPWDYMLLHISTAQLSCQQSIGMELGLRMRPTAHGFLGYALLSCNNLREAMQLSLRFMRIRQQQIDAQYVSLGDYDAVILEGRHDFGPVRHFFLEGMLIGVAKSAQYLANDGDLDIELWLDYPEPDYFARYQDQLPTLKFNQPDARLMLSSADLDRPLRMADPITSAQAISECERELARLADSPALVREVKHILEASLEAPPALEDIATSLCMSARSLKRKLASHDSNYQQLLNDLRFKRAKQLLEADEQNIQQVGLAIGYNEPASFTRAFKKWSGTSPKDWKAAHKA